MTSWHKIRQQWPQLFAENWKGVTLLALFALVALIGGGARADINSLILLRPVGAFAFVLGLACLTPHRYATFRPVLLFALAILVVIAIQLVPLPAGLWAWLPGHQPYAEAAKLVDMADYARPISLYPAMTWNAFFAALVPFGLLLFFASAHPRWRHYWLLGVLLFGFLSAVIGLLQVRGPAAGPLYFYDITNAGSATGLFSNRNHHAVLISLLPPLLVYAALSVKQVPRALLGWFALALWFFFLLVILTIGSRLGLLLYSLSSLATLFILPSGVHRAIPVPDMLRKWSKFAYPAAALALILIVALFATNNEATERLFASSMNGELRSRIVPTTLSMIGDFFPFGGGGGTFPLTYQLYEPADLLIQQYVNHVHNDFLEVAYAYGLPGIALIVAGIALIAYHGIIAWRTAQPLAETMAVRAALIGLAMLVIASATDYPLRTPSLAAIAVMLAATVLRHRDSREKKPGIGSGL